MRVGFDARWLNDSGVGTYVSCLLRAFATLDADCELFVYEDSRNPVPGLSHPSFHRLSVRAQKYSPAEQVELAWRCRCDKLDLFHSPFYVVPLAVPCPVIATFHDLIPFLFRIAPWPKQQLVKVGYRAATLRSSHLIAVSDTTSKDLQRILHVPDSKISTVYNGVAREHFHSDATSGEFKILGERFQLSSNYIVIPAPRNCRTKNLVTALRALALAGRALDFQIVAYGPGSLDDLLLQNGLQGRVIHTGFLSSSELGILLRHASAFLFTSLYEGFGLPIVEAMACGCPVVTSNGGSLAEVAGDGAQVFAPDDEIGMATAIANLLQDHAKRELWQERAINRASAFSWTRAAEQTLAVYNKLVATSLQSNAQDWSRA